MLGAMMKKGLLLLFAFVTPLLAGEPAAPAMETGSAATLLQAARNPEADFFEAYDRAREAGVPPAQLLEARIIKLLMTGDLPGLLAQIDKIEELRGAFEVGFEPNGPGRFSFVSQMEIEGLLQALKAVKAFQNEDIPAFEKHAKATYWAWPQWAANFQLESLIQQLRTREIIETYVADLTLPMDMAVRNLDGETLKLGDLFDGHRAVLLDFWASWCGPCIRLMPELQERANTLPEQGIYVAAVNTDDEDPLAKAASFKQEHTMDMPWLVEAEGEPLSSTLMIDSIPRMVLVSPQGRILFNGHPMDPELGEALARLGVTLPETHP